MIGLLEGEQGLRACLTTARAPSGALGPGAERRIFLSRVYGNRMHNQLPNTLLSCSWVWKGYCPDPNKVGVAGVEYCGSG